MRTSITVIIFAFLLASFCSPLAAQNNPVPFVNNPLVPAATPPNGPGFTLTVNGAGFVSGAVVKWNGSARTTNFVSSTQVTATILAADLAVPATIFVTVSNPKPGGGVSNVVTFEVTTPTTSLAFTRVDTNFPSGGSSSIAEPRGIIAANFQNNGTPFMAIVNGACPANRSCQLQKADITVVQSGSILAAVPFTEANPVSIAAGDFNGDAILDLVTVSGDSSVSISLGSGDGTFQPHQDNPPLTPTAVSPASPAALCDFDRDGHLDLIVATTAGIYFLPGNGTGTFGTPVLIVAGTSSGNASVAAGDFNGDGILDLVISNLNGNSVSILLGNGNGMFQSPVSYFTGSSPSTVVVADFNRDGKLDLGVLNYLGNTISILLGKGDGTFQPEVDYAAGITLSSLSSGDYNGDGIVDLAVGDLGPCTNSGCPATGSVNLLLGNGDGIFQSHLDFGSSGSPQALASGEFVDPSVQTGKSGFAAVNAAANTVSIFTAVPSGTSINSLPTIASLSPPSVLAGSGGFTLTLNGTNFVSGSNILFNGVAQTTTFVSATQLTAFIPASAVVTGGSATIVVINPAPGGGSSSSVSFGILLPPPAIVSLSPTSAVVGSPGFTLTINGTNFVAGAGVNFNGVQRSATFVSATQLTAAVLASDLSNQGSINVAVTIPPGVGNSSGGTSSAATLAILPTNSQPTVGALAPASTTAGGPSFTLMISGSGFGPSSSVTFGSSAVSSAYVSPTLLQVSIPASAIAVAGTPLVTVANPGGSPSLVTTFTVNNPIPAATSISPPSVAAGGAALSVNVIGANFTATSKVLVNGSARVTTFVSSTSLTVALLASDIASNGVLTISVNNPAPGGGTTGALTLAVGDYSVSASVQTATVVAGQTANYSLVLAPANGTTANTVTFAVTSGLPAGATPSFSPSTSYPAGTGQKTVMLSIATTAHAAASFKEFPSTPSPHAGSLNWIVPWTVLLALALLALGVRARRLTSQMLLVALLFIAAGLAACGGAGSGGSSSQLNSATGTPAGTYSIVVTATSSGGSINTSLTLTVM